jgi:hypothetical protein
MTNGSNKAANTIMRFTNVWYLKFVIKCNFINISLAVSKESIDIFVVFNNLKAKEAII